MNSYPSVKTCVMGAQSNMFLFRNKKNNFQIHTLIWRPDLIYTMQNFWKWIKLKCFALVDPEVNTFDVYFWAPDTQGVPDRFYEINTVIISNISSLQSLSKNL